MKNIHYELSSNDIDAICYALEIMPSYNFNENDSLLDLIVTLSASSGQKLLSGKQLTQREAYFVSLSIDCAYKALRGEMHLDVEELSGLRPYFFTINKLYPVFSPLLNEGTF